MINKKSRNYGIVGLVMTPIALLVFYGGIFMHNIIIMYSSLLVCLIVFFCVFMSFKYKDK